MNTPLNYIRGISILVMLISLGGMAYLGVRQYLSKVKSSRASRTKKETLRKTYKALFDESNYRLNMVTGSLTFIPLGKTLSWGTSLTLDAELFPDKDEREEVTIFWDTLYNKLSKDHREKRLEKARYAFMGGKPDLS